LVATFAAGDVDLPAVGRPAAAAARGRHLRALRAPGVGGRVVFLDDVGVLRGRHEGVRDASADDVDLPVHDAREHVVARSAIGAPADQLLLAMS